MRNRWRAARGGRSGGEFHRYGGCVWRWAERAIDRATAEDTEGAARGRDEGGPAAAEANGRRILRENLTEWVERSLQNLETDAIDLLQLHCPPTAVYYRPEVFGVWTIW